jgi:hypothetical protein
MNAILASSVGIQVYAKRSLYTYRKRYHSCINLLPLESAGGCTMHATYEGVIGVDERTKEELERTIHRYLRLLGFAPAEGHVHLAVHTPTGDTPHFSVTVDLRVYGAPLYTAKASGATLEAAATHAYDLLAEHLLSVIEQCSRGGHHENCVFSGT